MIDGYWALHGERLITDCICVNLCWSSIMSCSIELNTSSDEGEGLESASSTVLPLSSSEEWEGSGVSEDEHESRTAKRQRCDTST